MQSIAFYNDSKELLIKTEQTELKSISIQDELPSIEQFDFLIHDGQLDKEFIEQNEQLKNIPIINTQEIDISKSQFEDADWEMLYSRCQKYTQSWILKNNLSAIENMYTTVNEFKTLLQKNRDNFLQELWLYIKKNTGANGLTFIFHDVAESVQQTVKEEDKEKEEKPKLIYKSLTGQVIPEQRDANESEIHTLNELKKSIPGEYLVQNLDLAKGQLVASTRIGKSPLLIMLQFDVYNKLMDSILKGLLANL